MSAAMNPFMNNMQFAMGGFRPSTYLGRGRGRGGIPTTFFTLVHHPHRQGIRGRRERANIRTTELRRREKGASQAVSLNT